MRGRRETDQERLAGSAVAVALAVAVAVAVAAYVGYLIASGQVPGVIPRS